MKHIFLLLFVLHIFIMPALSGDYREHSVLSAGKWYKLGVTKNGIHRITYADLVSLGIDPTAISPGKIRLFGNGTGMLPETNSSPRIDDLREISIRVMDGNDGTFNEQDYILFYGESSDKWTFDRLTRFYSFQRNLYSDTTWYFLNCDQQTGRRVEAYPYLGLLPDYYSKTFDDPQTHQSDIINLLRTGKEWYGETFDNTTSSRDFQFLFPDINMSFPIRIRTFVAGKSPVPSYFYLLRDGVVVDSLKIDSTDPNEFTRAGRSKLKPTTLQPLGEQLNLTLSYNLPTPSSSGWLNYLEVTAIRHLTWHGPQMLFRDVNTIAPGRITQFSLSQAGTGVTVWDVSDPSKVLEMETVTDSNALEWRRPTDSLKTFIAFDGTSYLAVNLAGEVKNQDLHAHEPATLVIVTHPLFMEQANRLADHHRGASDMSVLVVPVNEILNEFACGQPDPTAIRDYIRMLWQKGSAATRPKYLLLFGDGSFDPKDRTPGNNNLIPTFQSAESLSGTSSYVTDDYFGIMAENSGQESNGTIDLGIGRFPVSTAEEAQAMVDKIIHYSTPGYPVASNWRNLITFIADDENINLHMHQAEEMVKIVAENYPQFNIGKIYFDAYKMEEIPGGLRFPDANKAVNKAVEDGSLIINYTGHGGESGWSYEQVVTTTDILSWKNPDKLPVFITATCEFSRFDNPERYTAGEMLINQPEGGAIALYSTTRLAFAGLNIMLNKSFFDHLMDKTPDGGYVKMGDLIRLSKNDNKNNFQLRNFVLLGDPAQSIAFPELSVQTRRINGKNAAFPDTVTGLSPVTVEGYISDAAGNRVSAFNGRVNCRVYDKPTTYSTLGNRPPPETYPETFKLQNSLLFEGDFPVTAGEFTFTFSVPAAIALQFDAGRISYYAWSDSTDAAGYNTNLYLGGRNPDIEPLNSGPELSVYLNSRDFTSGGVVSNPIDLIADIADSNGVNWLGLGIGHEIELVINGDRSEALVLNDYYKPAFNAMDRGSLTCRLPELPQGKHSLILKAWDMFDNPAEKEIVFQIEPLPPLQATNVITAPNPMEDYTRFKFRISDHFTNPIYVKIQIFDLGGRLVNTLKITYPNGATALSYFTWYGTDASGKPLPSGLYPYRLIITDDGGEYYETTQKLMITR